MVFSLAYLFTNQLILIFWNLAL